MEKAKLTLAGFLLKKDYLKISALALASVIAIVLIATMSVGGDDAKTKQTASVKPATQTKTIAKTEQKSSKTGKTVANTNAAKIQPETTLRKTSSYTRLGPPTKRLSSR